MARYGREYGRGSEFGGGRERETAWNWGGRGGGMGRGGYFGGERQRFGRGENRGWGEGGRQGYAGEYGGATRGGFGGDWSRGGGRRGSWSGSYDRGYRGYDRDLGDRLRSGWREVRESARDWFGRGRYDRGW